MTERFERIWAFGPPPMNYRDRETWTDEVHELYQRLVDGDDTALAPLITIDIEFLREPMAIAAIVGLKYDRSIPPRVAQAGLQRIANVIRRRPGRRGAKLPYGDRLHAELKGLEAWLETHQLLDLRRDTAQLRERVLEWLEPPKPRPPVDSYEDWYRRKGGLPRPEDQIPIPEPVRQKMCEAILAGVHGSGGRYTRTTRSWALKTLAHFYGVEAKDIEKRIARDLKSGSRNR